MYYKLQILPKPQQITYNSISYEGYFLCLRKLLRTEADK